MMFHLNNSSDWREVVFDLSELFPKSLVYELRFQADNLTLENRMEEDNFAFRVVVFRGDDVIQDSIVSGPLALYYTDPPTFVAAEFSALDLALASKIVFSYEGSLEIGHGLVKISPSIRP